MILPTILLIVSCVSAEPVQPPAFNQETQLFNSFDATEFNKVTEVISENVLSTPRNTDPYRLNTTVYPLNYALTLRLEQDFGTTQVFTGNVTINVQFLESTDLIKLHSKYLTIPNEGVVINCGFDTRNLFESLEFAEEYEMVYVFTNGTVQAGTYCELSFRDFSGELRDDMYGFYRSYYLDENGQTV